MTAWKTDSSTITAFKYIESLIESYKSSLVHSSDEKKSDIYRGRILALTDILNLDSSDMESFYFNQEPTE